MADFSQQAHACFSAAVSGDLVRIVDGDQQAYLIGPELFQFITECLLRYERIVTK